uniref:NADH-ubiquinone oxidoreductase chain 6 n=1 Tax=Trigonopterus tounensis TaxID=2896837 RepID=A0A7H1KHT7_9CUCU|nr:NADH dehydrogenase subunit 6 [Trigonopterus tounensis]
MLTLIMLMNWTLSMIFMFLNHPLSLGAILLIQSILIAMASGIMYLNFWFSYILFLVMIGGMVVLFIYMTSIASNEKFSIPKHSLTLTIFSISITLILLNLDNFTALSVTPEIYSNTQMSPIENLNLSKYFNHPCMNMLVMLMIYLLIALIAIVKIIDKTCGTLRQK